MSQAQIEKKVEGYLRNSQALEDYWQRPITADQLQAEMERMASHTKQPEVLRELFEALGNDPFVIAECLARPVLAERLAAGRPSGRACPERESHGRVACVDETVCSRHGCLYRESFSRNESRRYFLHASCNS